MAEKLSTFPVRVSCFMRRLSSLILTSHVGSKLGCCLSTIHDTSRMWSYGYVTEWSKQNQDMSSYGRTLHRKGYLHQFKFKLSYHARRISLSNDIETNPGPVRNPCSICSKPLRKNQLILNCIVCSNSSHATCEGVNRNAYNTSA